MLNTSITQVITPLGLSFNTAPDCILVGTLQSQAMMHTQVQRDCVVSTRTSYCKITRLALKGVLFTELQMMANKDSQIQPVIPTWVF